MRVFASPLGEECCPVRGRWAAGECLDTSVTQHGDRPRHAARTSAQGVKGRGLGGFRPAAKTDRQYRWTETAGLFEPVGNARVIMAVERAEKPKMRIGVNGAVEIEIMKADIRRGLADVWSSPLPARSLFEERGEGREPGRGAPTFDDLWIHHGPLLDRRTAAISLGRSEAAMFCGRYRGAPLNRPP